MNKSNINMDEADFTPFEENNKDVATPNFSKYIRGVWKRKWMVLLISILSVIPFYMSSKNQVPVYTTSALIRIKGVEEGEEGIDRTRQAELRTRSFAENVVAQLGLALQIDDTNGSNGRTDVFQVFKTSKNVVPGKFLISLTSDAKYRLYKVENLRSVCIDSASAWEVVDSERNLNDFTFRLNPDYISFPKDINFRINRFSSTVSQLLSRLRADFGNTTMRLSMKGEDPELLTRTVNRLAEFYVREGMSMQARDARDKRIALEKKLDAAEKELNEAEDDIAQFRRRYPQTLDAELSSVLKRKEKYESMLREIPLQIESLEDLLNKLESAKSENSEDKRIVTFVVHQLCNFQELKDLHSMAILRETLADQEKDYSNWIQQTSEAHPISIEKYKEIKKTADEIVSTARLFLTDLYRRKLDISDQLDKVAYELSKYPEEESRLAELKRQEKVTETQYESILSEVTKARLAESAALENMDILDPAVLPNRPMNTNQKQMVVIGGVLGIFLGIGLSVVLDLLDKRIRTISDVKSLLGLGVIGTIPNINFKDVLEYQDHEKAKHIDQLLVTHDYSPSPIGECYRSLRTNLMYSKNIGRIRLLVLTSTSPGEGKSFTSANLAIIFAQQRTNTLLVDADLRRGVLHNTFRCPKEPGLTNYLTNASTLSEIAHETHIPNLTVVSCGSLIPNPSELLGSLQMRRFLEECKRKFDIVVFDTPPLSAATDAVVLGTQSDGIALVVRSGITNKNMAIERLQLFNNIPANLIGVILNGADSELVPDNYSYYHY